MSATNDFFGWDLLYKTIEPKLSRESDILIALAHWFLIKNSFRCVGIGDDKTVSENDVPSELLPEGWNDNDESYALRYMVNKDLYILLGAMTEDLLILNLLDVKSRNVSNMAVRAKDEVKNLHGPLRSIMPNASEINERLKKELLDPVFTGTGREVTTQTQPERTSDQRTSPIRQQRRMDDANTYGLLYDPYNEFVDPLRNVGRGDLDPLGGGGGGGMLFPFRHNRPSFDGIPLPRGPRLPPPDARFDPIGPPGLGRMNPNPDHMRPPSEFYDMFM